jgi:hypothetical protein
VISKRRAFDLSGSKTIGANFNPDVTRENPAYNLSPPPDKDPTLDKILGKATADRPQAPGLRALVFAIAKSGFS